MTNPILYPWQTDIYAQLRQTLQQERLPHALLLSGRAGLGKRHFAESFAKHLLCMNHSQHEFFCGECHSCHLMQAQVHPDFKIIAPEEESHAIKIDTVRDIGDFVNETSMQKGCRVIIIDPAAAMNVNAANALLKMLEEPAPHAIFMLIFHEGGRLPATILSRCQTVHFNVPDEQQALTWLQSHITESKIDLHLLLALANQAPLRALALYQQDIFNLRKGLYDELASNTQPLALAKQWQEKDVFILLHLLQLWLRDVMCLHVTADQGRCMNTDYQKELLATYSTMTIAKLKKCLDHIQDCYRWLSSGINLNRQLMLEELFILMK